MRDSEYQSKQDWQNIMQNRNGRSANASQRCAKCRHLTQMHDFGDAADFWVCEQFTTPGGHKMPWAAENRACGLFEERVVGP